MDLGITYKYVLFKTIVIKKNVCFHKLYILFSIVLIADVILIYCIMFTVHLANITRLSLSHNKIQVVPAALANLMNLEILNLANNHIRELPVSLSSLPKLRILNVSLNRLYGLPRGFGAFPVIEILDLTYNNLNEKTLPGNFFMMGKLINTLLLIFLST